MRVVLIHRYFWPDAPPYASMLRTIGCRLVAEGHEVSVVSAQPSYNAAASVQRRPSREDVDGIRVHRVALIPGTSRQTGRRVVNALLFLIHVFARVAVRRDELVMFSTVPPVALGVIVRYALAASGRAGRYIYHVQDIYPETAVVSGLLREGLRYRLLRHVDTATCRNAAAVVVLSEDMRTTLLDRGVESHRIHVLNNFSLVDPDGAAAPPARVLPQRDPRDYVVAFAENLGRFQELETLIDAARRLRDELDIQFWIMGDGIPRDHLRRRAGDLIGRTVHFIDDQSPAVTFGVLEHVDLAVVSLRPGMHRTAFPSTTMTALMAGCRLLVAAEGHSDLARVVRDADLGRTVPPGDAGAVAAAIRDERRASSPLARAEARADARAYALTHYAADVVCDRWTELIKRVADQLVAERSR